MVPLFGLQNRQTPTHAIHLALFKLNGPNLASRSAQIRIIDSSGLLKLNDNGLLVLLNQNNTIIWSSNSSRVITNSVVQLLDSGNLVIRAENDLNPENFLWQSFDYPDRTFLPGMKIGTIAKGLDIRLSSWKSEDDPSPGKFTYQIDPRVLELVIKENSAVKNRYGPWNGVQFSGLNYLEPGTLFKYTLVLNQNEGEYYVIDDPVNRSDFTRLVLNVDGKTSRFIWIDRTGDWSVYGSTPIDDCDAYAFCGVYGSCDSRKTPICSCLDRFVPKYEKDWDGGDWIGGCVRRIPLDCKKGDKFITYSNVKLPDTKNWSTNASLTLEECKTLCLKDCSCMAYAVSDIKRGSGCFFWYGDLLDIKQLTKDGQDLYIRMASSETDDKDPNANGKSKTKVIAAIFSVAGVIFLGLAFAIFVRKRKQRKYRTMIANLERSANNNNKREDLELPLFDLGTIASATNNFSFSSKLGEGGFGPVYKGVLKNGQEVAVKRLSTNSKQGVDEFKNEVVYIAKLQHRNLVKLLGCCIQKDEMMLIYEFMPNKSLMK
ncbi:G-type lectin S-receptor-like serine/threonine-protein kinase At4g27290 [Jatropha curcas]|uniref:G-type lectin S-receptor-like serine/threonine-protein kinase At4g27290 n=1 Tax=Jatropha curcas TaxID=180498 RepID=UPI0018953CC4|nr:G-type lectin S-receptor-like serine/threonine-protein kinase At4g27290 [Jatropha curcas]